MKRVLILCLHRPNRSPSQRFRFEQYLGYLEQNGYEFDFSYLLDQQSDKIYYKPGQYGKKLMIVMRSITRRLRELMKARRYDLVFVQREAFMLGTPFFERAIAGKVPMIFDFDDSIWLQTVSESNKKLAFLKDASKTARIIEKAALVFAGNEFLADYARQFNNNVVIVPTTIDTDVYKPVPDVKDKQHVCIGWSGSFSTIEHFETALPALRLVKERFGGRVSFKIIGDGNYYCKDLDAQGLPWIADTEVRDLSTFDIGIMPLPDTEWAKGKCGLKGLQYMALGIPTLMSPVGVNTEIIQHGENGFLPRTEDEWIACLSELIESEELRRRIGDAGKATLEAGYATKAWDARYLQYFDEVCARRQATTA
jgi:glycosyltransferase involved in cell wall biosynthesis